jgi:hypothetical protein
MRLFVGCTSILFLFSWGTPQVTRARPKFEDYSMRRIFQGSPAKPVLNRSQRMFRTMIRRGAKAPVEFAGHYTVPLWGLRRRV